MYTKIINILPDMTPKEKQGKIKASSNSFFVSNVHEEKDLSNFWRLDN